MFGDKILTTKPYTVEATTEYCKTRGIAKIHHHYEIIISRNSTKLSIRAGTQSVYEYQDGHYEPLKSGYAGIDIPNELIAEFAQIIQTHSQTYYTSERI